MSYRKPSEVVREKTTPKPNIHDERHERAGELRDEKQEAFLDEVNEDEPDEDES